MKAFAEQQGLGFPLYPPDYDIIQAFGGLTANTLWYDTTIGIVMFAGRLLPMVIVLAIGGSLGRKKFVPATAGTFPTGTPLFGGLLFGVVLIVLISDFGFRIADCGLNANPKSPIQNPKSPPPCASPTSSPA